MRLNEVFSGNADINKQYGQQGVVYYNFFVNDIEYQFTIKQVEKTRDVKVFEMEFYPTSTDRPKFMGLNSPDELPSQEFMIGVLNGCLAGFDDYYSNEMDDEYYYVFKIEPYDQKLNRLYNTMLNKIGSRYSDLDYYQMDNSFIVTDLPEDELR